MTKIVMDSFATMALLGNIFIVVLLIALVIDNLFGSKMIGKIKDLISPYAYHLTFMVSLIATLGSLFLSEVAKLPPCVLCWYQRIFMYPQPILLYVAIIRNETFIIPYLIILNTIGGLISSYHYLIQRAPNLSLLNCQIGGEISCTKTYSLYYGYITIPLMALTAFILNIIFLKFADAKDTKRTK